MFKAKVTSKGQVTIPKELRAKIGLRPGDFLCIKETKEGYVLNKEIKEEAFDKYVGLLNKSGKSDKVIEELRGK